jgi:hypothetical protein
MARPAAAPHCSTHQAYLLPFPGHAPSCVPLSLHQSSSTHWSTTTCTI